MLAVGARRIGSGGLLHRNGDVAFGRMTRDEGLVDVATEPGQFTEFTIILPRTSNLKDKKRGEA